MKIVVSLIGDHFSGNFLLNWTQTFLKLIENNHTVYVNNCYEAYVPFSRMRSLGLSNFCHKPFDGKLDYDVWLTIDNDIIFNADQVLELIEDTKTHDVVSGLYYMANGVNFPCVADWDKEYFINNGSFEYLTLNDIDEWKKDNPDNNKYMSVVYNGMGFFACKKGVIETMEYPYFWYELQNFRLKDGRSLTGIMCSEDVSFCRNLVDAGHKIHINTGLILGHEKKVIIK